MVEEAVDIRLLSDVTAADCRRLIQGFTSPGRFRVTFTESREMTQFSLHYEVLPEPLVRRYEHLDAETMARYQGILAEGYSFGAYADGELVGLLLAGAQAWNRTIWVWEFHVDPAWQGRGIGRRLMARLAVHGRAQKMRAIVCETQNVNTGAIFAYRKLGFRLEAVDISYYSNEDYPDGDIAVFMKKRI